MIFEYQIPDNFTYHHTASARGYVTRQGIDRPAEPYIGRFGTGYIVRRPRYDTTRYHYVVYYIGQEAPPA